MVANGRKGHAVLLGDADVETTIGKFLGEEIKPGSRRHRGRDGHDLVVLLGFADEGLCIDLGIGGGCRLRLCLSTGCHIELDDAVIFVGRFFGRLVALALFGDDVNEKRPVLGVPYVYKHRQEMVDVVAIDGPDIEESELVEQGAAGDEAASVFLHGHCSLLEERR
jgi:hypothetical protein